MAAEEEAEAVIDSIEGKAAGDEEVTVDRMLELLEARIQALDTQLFEEEALLSRNESKTLANSNAIKALETKLAENRTEIQVTNKVFRECQRSLGKLEESVEFGNARLANVMEDIVASKALADSIKTQIETNKDAIDANKAEIEKNKTSIAVGNETASNMANKHENKCYGHFFIPVGTELTLKTAPTKISLDTVEAVTEGLGLKEDDDSIIVVPPGIYNIKTGFTFHSPSSSSTYVSQQFWNNSTNQAIGNTGGDHLDSIIDLSRAEGETELSLRITTNSGTILLGSQDSADDEKTCGYIIIFER